MDAYLLSATFGCGKIFFLDRNKTIRTRSVLHEKQLWKSLAGKSRKNTHYRAQVNSKEERGITNKGYLRRRNLTVDIGVNK